jgi:RNA polymerase sigma-70 factor, ECF subfamily
MTYSEWEIRIRKELKKGKCDAFRQLYEKFYPGLCVLARRYTRRQSVAEEIVQETFMKLWENRAETEIRENLHSYLYASVRNSSLNYLKRLVVERKYNSGRIKELQRTLNTLHFSQEDGSSILIAEELQNSLEGALASLPPRCREIFILHRKEGMKYSLIAEKLGITENTVQRQISIALEKLREKLLPHLHT